MHHGSLFLVERCLKRATPSSDLLNPDATTFCARKPRLRVEFEKGRLGGTLLGGLALAELVSLVVSEVELLTLRLYLLGSHEISHRPAKNLDLVPGGNSERKAVTVLPRAVAALLEEFLSHLLLL